MSTKDTTNYPPRIRRLRESMSQWRLTHGERITLISAMLGEDFSPETVRCTLQKLKEHDLTPVRCFYAVCVQDGHNGKQGPQESDSEKRETFIAEVSSEGEDVDDFAQAITIAQEQCKELYPETPGWDYKYRVITLFEWNPYARTATEIHPVPAH